MSNTLLMILMTFVMVFWGGSWVNAKVLVKYASPEALIFWRFALTSITMIPVMLWLKESFRFKLPGFIATLSGAILLVIYNEFFFMGLRNGLASVGGVLTTTLIPVLTYFINKILSRGKVYPKDIIGLCLGICGAAFILRIWHMDWHGLVHSGNIFFLLAALFWAVLTNLSSRVKTILSPLGFSFYLFFYTALLDFVFVLHGNVGDFSGFDWIFWVNLFMLAVLATTYGTSVYFICAGKLGSEKTSSFIFLVPLCALAFSVIFLGEKVLWSTMAGGLLAISAVYLINKKPAVSKS
jgi:drug/metabolite transporter (DMT)-like permease